MDLRRVHRRRPNRLPLRYGQPDVDLRAQAKAINTALGGKGGGQPTMIQGSVTAGQAAILAYFQ